MKQVLCYGDSNTWGFNPIDGSRFLLQERWPGILQDSLGPEFHIVEDGINGRTTVWDDPYVGDFKNGLKGLKYSLNAHKPLDLIVLMLGSNDLNYTDAEGTQKGLFQIMNLLCNCENAFKDTTRGSSPFWRSNPMVLLVAPITRHPSAVSRMANGQFLYDESTKLGALVKSLAKEFNMPFLDASAIAQPSEIDTLHMDKENHYLLANSIASAIKEIFK